MIKLTIIHALISLTFAVNAKVVFFDGTFIVGNVKMVDESSIHIIPMGLETSEVILVGNIDTLKLENGMIPVVNSSVKYFYRNGEFLSNNYEWIDEADEISYDDYTSMSKDYKYEGSKRTHQSYPIATVYFGLPVMTAVSLQEENGTFSMSPNFGLSFQLPYYAFGAVDISPGIRFMNYTFESSFQGRVEAIQLGTDANIDLKPILYFFPENLHMSVNAGFDYNFAYDINQDSKIYKSVETVEPGAKYTGFGVGFGTSLEYWQKELPLALRIWGRGNLIPQAPPFTDQVTMFGNIGISVALVFKRNR